MSEGRREKAKKPAGVTGATAPPPTPPPEPPEQKPAVEEILAKLQADSAKMQANVEMMAQAIVKLNEKFEEVKKGGASSGGGGSDIIQVLRGLAEGNKSSVEGLVKEAEGMAKLAENLDRFRSRGLGIGEAFLMRLGLRAAYPRYMTKHELARTEKVLGIGGLFEEEATEHVSE